MRNDAKSQARAALEIVPLLAEVLGAAKDQGGEKFLEELKESISKSLDQDRGRELVTAEEIQGLFELISICLIAIFSLARHNLEGEDKSLFDEAVRLFTGPFSSLGVQSILALEKLARH